ncbi:NAD-dependent epimerase/dehydratase family protein [Curvivirga aplysinae]|uniref:NAD-dependent epimerase/dehydratase family protein n=1 Tax=Curvivirga aplysinae TaxID=2529852 RepID=UPI0012BB7408|nr:NAD-dependent epimerase/dehydratase family protein [Curvivirga aplysinae]MTI08919.1 NAD-dependent epimerase/dehydratase family protein [Curvivirga aplysinae]
MADETVLITGGAGYVGSMLTMNLLEQGYNVKVLDLYLYGDASLESVRDHPNLIEIKGDLRDQELLKTSLEKVDKVIHLACVSNDPSFELNPALSKAINFDAFEPLVELSKDAGVKMFIYASSASVYGVSDADNVTEDHPLLPITDYNKYKGLCEPILLKYKDKDFCPVIIRPATVCGYSTRQRFDLSVNILTSHAVNNRKITVFGGSQKRPNLHIKDMISLYSLLLKQPAEKVSGKIWNAGYQNHKMIDIATIVREVVAEEFPREEDIEIVRTSSDDVRSYHISSEKINAELGFFPQYDIGDAVRDLCQAFKADEFGDIQDNSLYSNIKRMQELDLQ